MTRAERVHQVQALKAEGLNGLRIAERLGISRSHAYALLNDPDGSAERERKDSYRQPCLDCGVLTNGSDGVKNDPLCQPCAAKRAGAAKKYWTREAVIEAIQAWAELHGEHPAAPDWTPTIARTVLHDEERAARFEDAGGAWPSASTVVREFGTWSMAMEAAGFVSRAPHGGDGNQWRHRRFREAA